jgi:hypothetical protein
MTAPTPIPPIPNVVELLGAMLVRMVMAIAGRVSWSSLSPQVVQLICDRVRVNKQRIDQIVAQIRAGTYVFRRRTGKPRAPAPPGAERPPRPPSPLPQKFGWLLPLIPAKPEEYWHANALRSQLESALQNPEMVALIEAAPVSLGRPLRSLCWMFGLKRPPILAPPRRTAPHPTPPRAAKPKAAAKAKRPPPLPSRPPTRPDAPAWMQNWPPPVRGSRKLA